MKKNTGHWLKRARLKRDIMQKDLAGDRFTASYINHIEKGNVKLSYKARVHVTKILKLPKKYFDTGLFIEEKERLDKLIKDIDTLLDHLKFDEALKKLTEALKISEEAKNDNYTYSLLLKLARIYIKTDRLNKAEELLNKVNKYYSEEKDYKNLAYSYYWTGVLYREKGNHEEALLMFNKSVEENLKLKRKKDLSLIARATVKIAQIHRFNEIYKAAKQKYQEAINIAIKSKDDYVIAMAYWGYGLLLQRTGEYEEAIEPYKKAAPIYKKLGNEKLYLQAKNNLASIYHYISNYDKAIDLTKKTIKISKEKNYVNELAHAYLKGAKAKRDKNLIDEAESDLNKSINLLKKLEKEKRVLGEAYMALGLLHEKKKENDKAILSFNKATELFKKIDQPIYLNSAYGEIIRFYKDMGSLDMKRENIQGLVNYTNKLISKIKTIIF